MGRRRLTYTDLCVADTPIVLDLCATWWKDSAWYLNTGMEFKSDPNYWYSLFAQGVMIGCVGRDDDNIARSCYVAVKQQYLFNQDYITASEVVWCLDEEHRTGRNLLELMSKIEDVLKRTGVDIYNLNLPVQEGHDRLNSKMKRMGFFDQDISMFKEIKR